MARPYTPYALPSIRVAQAAEMADDLATGADWVTPDKIVDRESATKVAAAVWRVEIADVKKLLSEM